MSGSGSSVAREGACVNSDTSRESDVTQRIAQATATPGRCLCVTGADTHAAPRQTGGYSTALMRPVPHLLLWYLGLARAETQTSARERQALARYAAGASRVIEIGVWHGVTTAILRAAMAPGGVLWAVDPFPRGRLGFSPQRPIALRQVRSAPDRTVVWIRETGSRAGELYRARETTPVDLV
jgi:hypothetical protein